METGQKLPENLGFDQDGKEWKTSELAGKKVVLYIYPKDSTPGCTNQACSLRDNYERFIAQGYVVIGVSAQDAKSHKKFIEKYSLPFPLIDGRAGCVGRKKNGWQNLHGSLPYNIHH